MPLQPQKPARTPSPGDKSPTQLKALTLSKKRASQPRKKQQPATQIDYEHVSKIRASGYTQYSRFSRYSEFLIKTKVSDDFQIRKSLNTHMRELLEQQGRRTYFQRVFILAQNIDSKSIAEPIDTWKQPTKLDYKTYVRRILDKIFEVCEKKKCTQDHLSGCLLCMGEDDTVGYSYMMIEGSEDMLADFFVELAKVLDQIWTVAKVFLVEDKTDETYFNSFEVGRAAAINVNEKFPPSTVNDHNLMRVQHQQLMAKIKALTKTLSDRVRQAEEPFHVNSLPADPYNKLLPEIQRMQLVFSCNKYYYDVKNFALTYRRVPNQLDDDGLFWPMPNNFTPLNIFERSPFDVNLTFHDYVSITRQTANESIEASNGPSQRASKA